MQKFTYIVPVVLVSVPLWWVNTMWCTCTNRCTRHHVSYNMMHFHQQVHSTPRLAQHGALAPTGALYNTRTTWCTCTKRCTLQHVSYNMVHLHQQVHSTPCLVHYCICRASPAVNFAVISGVHCWSCSGRVASLRGVTPRNLLPRRAPSHGTQSPHLQIKLLPLTRLSSGIGDKMLPLTRLSSLTWRQNVAVNSFIWRCSWKIMLSIIR